MKIRVLLISGCFAATSALAQVNDANDEMDSDPDAEQAESLETLDDPERGDDPLADLVEAENAALEPDAEVGEDVSLEDFDPSEKISEDKSVSFPNDI